jgi:AcrR family transcriptional regulator
MSVNVKFFVMCYSSLVMKDVSKAPGGLRERTRRAVQREITEAAQRLFVERGYEATTVDDIAAEVGMSARSVFRYFPTKEDLIVGKFDLVAEEMLQALRSRPAGEPVWESLRRIFDLLVPYVDAPGKHEVAEPMQQVVFASPPLLASYLSKLQLMQDAAETAIRERAAGSGHPYAGDDPTPSAVAGAAFGCLVAAQKAWLAGGAMSTFAETIDKAMAAVGPR